MPRLVRATVALGEASARRSERAIRAYGLALLAAVLLAAAGYGLPDPWHELVYGEDRLIESASAVLFLAAFALAALRSARHPARRGTVGVLGGVALVGFLDEVSFGERVFLLHMPRVSGVKVDAAHDLLDILWRRWQPSSSHDERVVYGAIALAAVASVALIVAGLVVRRIDGSPIPAYRRMIAVVVGLLALAVLFDLDLVRGALLALAGIDPASIGLVAGVEEAIEMNAALALLVAVRLVPRG